MHEPLADSSAMAARLPLSLQVAPLQGLTAEQARAVTYGSGPPLIIAGPGAARSDADPPDRLASGVPSAGAVGDPRGDIQRPGGRRAEAEAGGPARRASRGRCRYGDVPLGVCSDASRGRCRVWT